MQDNQKTFAQRMMLLDIFVLVVSYIIAWYLRFMGPFAYSAEKGLSFSQYMLALVFIVPGYMLLYQAFTLYEPLHMQGRRLMLANIIKANVLGMLAFVFLLYMLKEEHYSRLTVYIFCAVNILLEWGARMAVFLFLQNMRKKRAEPEADDTGRVQQGCGGVY